ncbi:DUF4244 domain-containing protein [Lentzea albidocapillata]|uniref:DUF4244 domain-containing protein n=1 Tax=Lentzea albidocapillata TaxID=40571 RepID=UPI00115FD3DA|nr:DUF4244 domain-containing protein [Lentzea albidocapillata]
MELLKDDSGMSTVEYAIGTLVIWRSRSGDCHVGSRITLARDSEISGSSLARSLRSGGDLPSRAGDLAH